MGHLRTGVLPRTRHWLSVVEAVALASGREDLDTREIAHRTLIASRDALNLLPGDPVLQRCYSFLAALAVAGGSKNPFEEARQLGLEISSEPDKFALSRALRLWIGDPPERQRNPEFAAMARQATVDAVVSWINTHQPVQESLLPLDDPYFPWRAASTGSGFCELSRVFFSKFMQRYMGYFLSRVTSHEFASVDERMRFDEAVNSEMDKIAQHALETTKLIQSFSAGWFNKRAVNRLPEAAEVQGFLKHCFAKFREELRREVASE